MLLASLCAAPSCYRGGGQAHASEDAGEAGGDSTQGSGSADEGSGGSDESGGAQTCTPAELDMRRMTELQYRRTIAAIFDDRVAPSDEFPAPSGETPTGFSTELGAREVSEHDIEQIVYAAEDVAEAVVAVLPELLPCAAEAAPDEACVDAFLVKYGRRAYRRALTDDERTRLVAAWSLGVADGASFADAMGLLVDEMLQTPQFLYVVEYAAPTARPLEGFEVASRLSFLLWDSIPDDELLELAESDALADPTAITEQAERMLASPDADTTVARFFREWTQARALTTADKSPELFPSFDTQLASSMNESFDRFTVSTLREGGTLDDLLRSNEAWVDAPMAELLELDPPPDGAWTKVTLAADRYRGVLTQPALLAALAHSDRSSYVFRGAFLRRRLLCQNLPPPPANAMGVHFELPPDPTAKQESEARLMRADCGACHSLIDPGGLALETFDALGRYAPTDALGRTIDPSGTLLGVGGGEITFADHTDMIDQLAVQPELRACFARNLFRFALSRMETVEDECTIADIEAVLDDTDGDLASALVAIVGTDAFAQREAP
ncbi:MAG TPA: DUF1592 domain-containing protein [Nannocystaceae bacterium]|nr:DUF1592 domain-containing protein [Nannocystaceae bacterium]